LVGAVARLVVRWLQRERRVGARYHGGPARRAGLDLLDQLLEVGAVGDVLHRAYQGVLDHRLRRLDLSDPSLQLRVVLFQQDPTRLGVGCVEHPAHLAQAEAGRLARQGSARCRPWGREPVCRRKALSKQTGSIDYHVDWTFSAPDAPPDARRRPGETRIDGE
jgi:hypothetical protein